MTLALFALLTSFTMAQEISKQAADSTRASLTQSKEAGKRISLMLRLAGFYITKPGELKKDLDSAGTLINQARVLNVQVKSVSLAGDIDTRESALLREKGDLSRGKKTAERAVSSLKNTGNEFLTGKAYLELANYYNFQNAEIHEKIRLNEQALAAFQNSHSIEQAAFTLKTLGDLYFNNDENEKALTALNQSLAAYKKLNSHLLHPVYVLMGSVYLKLENFQQALNYQLLALQNAEAVHDYSMQYCEINNHIGLIYLDLKEHGKAVPYLKTALETAYHFNDSTSVYVITYNLSVSYIFLDDPSSAIKVLDRLSKSYRFPPDVENQTLMCIAYLNTYLKLNNYAKGTPYAKFLLDMMSRRVIPEGYMKTVYIVFVKYYTAARQYNLAAEYARLGLTLSRKLNDNTARAKIYKFMFMLDTAQHHHKSAIINLLEYNRLNDSIYNETKIKQIQVLQIEYETKQKESDIKILKEKDKLHQHELAQSRQSRKFYIAGVVMLALLLAIGYNRYQFKQKSNVELQNKQQEITAKNYTLERLLKDNEWLLREVHHRVKNNLQLIISLLTSQSVYLKDEVALNAVLESQHRVQAMSLIHQKLYKHNNISNIYMPDYINDLLDYLKYSYNIDRLIHFERQVDGLFMDVSQAIPIGLILNEAITNAIKYAFPDGREAVINLLLTEVPIDCLMLRISDNGVGLPPGFQEKEKNSFGLTLIQGLADDLSGTVEITGDKGTVVQITFPKEIATSTIPPDSPNQSKIE